MNQTVAWKSLVGLVLICGLCEWPAAAQTFTVLHAFKNGSDDQQPLQGLVRGHHGKFYGTTGGPSFPPSPTNGGTVFRLNADGALKTLVRFKGSNGANPGGGHLLRDEEEGNFYGLTGNGGTLPDGTAGSGTVYRVSPRGELKEFYVFTGGADGSGPAGTLLRDRRGNLYGTTIQGGTAASLGTVFKLNREGRETVLHAFTGGGFGNPGSDGSAPIGGLVRDEDGNMFGVTTLGGVGYGTVFEISRSGEYKVVYSFKGAPDGTSPSGGLIIDHDGSLYGTTLFGGFFDRGVVFKVDSGGNETILHNFAGSFLFGDGAYPNSGVIRDEDGTMYGTTAGGSADKTAFIGWGTVYKLDPTGTEVVLHSFPVNGPEGSPAGTLLRDDDGTLYGVTQEPITTGPPAFGTVYKITP